ncbi:MAG TPA: oxidoreductase [Solirubrobacteraceae bacterium]|jgi:aryl-alcohol dehydrogenase-like predicted oxidoreductase|nr:oxidoreductase [Solirubrobacteraceae bacterium]
MNTTRYLGEKAVKPIGFGAMQLAGPNVFGPPPDPEAARAVLRRAVDLGVDHIDTSQYYGPDVVNELIRAALHPYPEDLKLVTKVGGRRDGSGNWLPALSPPELRQGVEDNLRTLGVERMDLVNLRLFDEHDRDGHLPEQLGVLDELRQEGKLDLIGVSNAATDAVVRALELSEIACVQNAFSVVNRSGEDVLSLCEERGLAFVPFFPLGSAFINGPKHLAEDPTITEIAERLDATPSQIALSWLLHRSERILLIPGTRSLPHLEENVAAGDIRLGEHDMQRLESARQIGDPLAGDH